MSETIICSGINSSGPKEGQRCGRKKKTTAPYYCASHADQANALVKVPAPAPEDTVMQLVEVPAQPMPAQTASVQPVDMPALVGMMESSFTLKPVAGESGEEKKLRIMCALREVESSLLKLRLALEG